MEIEKSDDPKKASLFTSEVVGGDIKKRKRKEKSAAIEGKGTCLHCIITRHFANGNKNTNDQQRSHLPLTRPNCISIQHLSVKPVTLFVIPTFVNVKIPTLFPLSIGVPLKKTPPLIIIQFGEPGQVSM